MINCDDYELHPRKDFFTCMYVLSFLVPIVNLFAIYCIIFKSTKQMNPLKWYLLLYQITSSMFDFIFIFVTLPVVFFPLPMGYTGSWMAEWFSISVHTTFLMVIPTFPCVASCIFSLFAYRLHVIIPHGHFLRNSDRGHVYASFTFFVVYLIPTIVGLVDSSPDQTEARQWILSKYSCAASVMNVPRLHIYTLDSVKRLLLVIVVLVVMTIPMGVIILGSSLYFLYSSNNLSKKTRQLQRRFFFFLCIQVLVPAFSLVVPILVAVFSLGASSTLLQNKPSLQPYLKTTTNVAIIAMGLHGSISSITLIFCNEPYRQFALSFTKNRWKRKETWKFISVSGSTEQSTAQRNR